jgi:hypothetical protein
MLFESRLIYRQAPKPRPLEAGVETEITNAITAIDILLGGDTVSRSGLDHMIAEPYPIDVIELPKAYRDLIAGALRLIGGVQRMDSERGGSYYKKHP